MPCWALTFLDVPLEVRINGYDQWVISPIFINGGILGL